MGSATTAGCKPTIGMPGERSRAGRHFQARRPCRSPRRAAVLLEDLDERTIDLETAMPVVAVMHAPVEHGPRPRREGGAAVTNDGARPVQPRGPWLGRIGNRGSRHEKPGDVLNLNGWSTIRPTPYQERRRQPPGGPVLQGERPQRREPAPAAENSGDSAMSNVLWQSGNTVFKPVTPGCRGRSGPVGKSAQLG